MFKIGCDPELFLADAAGALVSAIDRIGGSKRYPRPINGLPEGFAVQEDNVAVEFNIPPATNKLEWVTRINQAMSALDAEIQQQGLHFVQRSSAVEWSDFDMMHPMAQEFGCDPDFNAWKNNRVNKKPKAPNPFLRTCGGHIHVGYKFRDNNELIKFIKLMDLHAGVPSVLMDDNIERRLLYGAAGCNRPKPYGVEYRTLSNFWVHKPELVEWAYDVTERAMNSLLANDIDVNSEKGSIINAINEGNTVVAKQLVDKYNLYVI